VKYIQKNEYDIKYVYNGSYYKIKIINHPNVPQYVIDKILDQDKNEITDTFIPYLGPKYNFHNIPYRPVDFFYKQISVYYTSGDKDTFDEKDVIQIRH